ncbi:MAG: NAD(P)-dependent oxidoreductase [Proteobacteria bacterium]|nr:NAD(P)-dependent oxidoreductase [Pseudomonadota bacterium]
MTQHKPIETLGFIGLGVMGERMCANLIARSARPVYGHDTRREPRDRLARKGLRSCASIGEVAAAADAVFLSLPSGVEVEAVCLGPGGLAPANGRVHTVIDMSTSPVRLMRDIAPRLARRAIAFADAPVSGMRQRASDGTLSVMVGAEAALFAAIRPLLACMGATVTHCGAVGCGQMVKALNNMVVFMNVNALAEAITIGRRAGLDAQLLLETMAKGSSDSAALRTPGLKHMVPGHFPEDAFPTDYALKDMRIALELARDTGVVASAARHTCALLEATSRAGYGRNYYPAMVKLIESEQDRALAGQEEKPR